jgi:hypothetical protein
MLTLARLIHTSISPPRHHSPWPALTHLDVEVQSDRVLCTLMAAVSMSPPLVSRLRSLTLGRATPLGASKEMFLPPLGRLTAVTKLDICSPVDEASTGWLPPSLVELALRPNALYSPYNRGVGHAWLDAAAACTALRVLDLVELQEGDLGGGVWFVDVLNQVGRRADVATRPAGKPAALRSVAAIQ